MGIDRDKLRAAGAELTDSLRFLEAAVSADNETDIIAGIKAVHVDADELYKVGTGRDVEQLIADLRDSEAMYKIAYENSGRRIQELECVAKLSRAFVDALDARRSSERADPTLGAVAKAAEEKLREILDLAVPNPSKRNP